jgi:ABC-type lipoprotein export system ATPase subunit
MNITFDGTYKSLTPFAIHDIPRFMVITGPNGSGKSQLLELIELSAQQRRNPRAVFVGETYADKDVLRLTSEWTNLSNPTAIGFQAVQKQHEAFWKQFCTFAKSEHRPNTTSHLVPLFQTLCQQIAKQPDKVTKDDFTQNFDLSVPAAQTQVFNQSISQAFLDFRIRQLEARESGRPLKQTPPWSLLREIISEASLPFAFTDPSETSIRAHYQFTLTHTGFEREIQFSDLSSGEKVLMTLAFWLFHVRRTCVFPRLLLLDEPDAHLHPEMCQQFLDVVNRVLVGKHEVQVIMTTHNPVTVALSPRDAVYEMFSTGNRIRKVQSKSEAIRRLTAGLVDVLAAKTVVIVEDEDDQMFFQFLFDELAMDGADAVGPSRLGDGERLVFIQASRPRQDRRPGDTTGGRTEVQKWVPRLRSVGLSNIAGLVDWDSKDDTGDSIHLLKRYSLENYLLDPIVVFCRLVTESVAPEIPGVPELARNREHSIVTWKQDQLQSVADAITRRVSKRLATESRDTTSLAAPEKRQVAFVNGVQLHYPRWLFESRGKDLLRAHIDEFGGQYVNQKKLTDTFRQIMFIPKELVDLLQAIQRPRCGAGSL